MSDDNFAADLSAELGDTSAQSEPVSESAAPVETSAPEGAATIEPAQATTASPSTTRGPIPFDVHHTALENARQKAVSEWEQQYGWAKGVDRSQVEQAVQLAQLYSTDRAGYIRSLMSEAINDPQLAPAVRSEAARLLGMRQAPAAPGPVELVPVQLEDGTVVQMPRDPQAWMAQQREQLEAEFEKKYSPALKAAEKLQNAENVYNAKAFAQSFDDTIQKELPGMHPEQDKDNRKAVATRVNQLCEALAPEQRENTMVLDLLTRRAWAEIVLPKLQLNANRKVLNDINAAATANVVNPRHAGTAAPKTWDEMTTAEALAHALAQQG